ncbi:hypothetical protein LAL4801_06087 [Roseibium aggregatum]|jgi:hypothetical protein|uniref:Uncharacterized protein n=1 Tax=Roseibium aggregatum TaxID=187304 RepID=A0A0M6YC01_9HYPH|nr:hypothetical protein LAL4801_06087 [Roseibium aggregatum]
MKLCFCFPNLAKSILAVVLIIAGGSFSHSFADAPHGHTYEIATNGSHVHAEETSEFERPLADHETVHCGANLLALTQDNLLNGPYLLKDNISISLALAFSRVGKLDPPPPRPTFLSI